MIFGSCRSLSCRGKGLPGLLFDDCDDLALEQHVLGQTGHLDAGARGEGLEEVAGVDRVDRAEIVADAPYSVVSREKDRVVLRTRTDKDAAQFFRFVPPAR